MSGIDPDVLEHVDRTRGDVERNVELQLKAFRVETRWLIIAGVVANQTVAHIHVPATVGFVFGGVVLAKTVAVLFSR